MKKALIFGAAGFVGRYLCDALRQKGYSVFGSDLEDCSPDLAYDRFFRANLLNASAVCEIISSIRPTHIINLAAISNVGLSWKHPQDTVCVNVCGMLNILDAIKDSQMIPRVLLVGSSEEYAPSLQPLDENATLNARNPYGVSKVMQEMMASAYQERYGIKAFFARAFNHTGIGQKDTFVVPGWCKQCAQITKSGKPGIIRVGNINIKRDFSHVKDVVRAYCMILESDHFGTVFNVGSGIAISLRDMLEFILSLSNQPIRIMVDKTLVRPVDNAVICCDHSLITKKIGWNPCYSVYDAINEIYEANLHDEYE